MKLEVISQSQLSGIYQKFHDVVGHPGMIATVNAIQQRYSCTWPGCTKTLRITLVTVIIHFSFHYYICI